MDNFLFSLASSFQLRLVEVDNDGNCLFSAAAVALSRDVFPEVVSHAAVRNRVVQFLRQHKEVLRVTDAHIARMSMPGAWGGELEMVAIANVYRRCVEVYMFDPTGRAVHARTYSPASGIETALPIRLSLLPFTGRIEDAPNHFSFLEKFAVDLGARAAAAVPAPIADVVEIMDEDDVVVVEAPAPAAAAAAPAAPAPAAAAAAPTKKPTYYKVYETLLARGMRTVSADLAAKSVVAWYSCGCGGACRKAATGEGAWEVVKSAAPVEPECKLWKMWRTYHDARAHGTIFEYE